MDVVCASCGKRMTVLTGAATLPVCDCGGSTWKRSEDEVLLGVVEPAPWIFVGTDDPDSPAFQNGWGNARYLADGTVEIQSENPTS